MLFLVFLALFLPCVGMSAVFVVYMCLLWYSAGTGTGTGTVSSSNDVHAIVGEKGAAAKGLKAEELQKLPKVTGKELVLGNECAVCLDEIGGDQAARLVPGCNHGFHLECADTWLSNHSACPVCRANLGPEMFDSAANPC